MSQRCRSAPNSPLNSPPLSVTISWGVPYLHTTFSQNHRLTLSAVLFGSAPASVHYGTPQEIVTDNGGEFKWEFGVLLQRCDITHHLTSPHHPQANELVERMNQTVRN